MKYCPKCNSEYADRFRYCRLDGTPLSEKQAAETAQQERNFEQVEEFKSIGLASEANITGVAESPTESSIHLTKEPPDETQNGAQIQSPHFINSPVVSLETEQPIRNSSQGIDSKSAPQDRRSEPTGAAKFELLAQEEIKKTYPAAFVRVGVQIRSLRGSAEVDLFVLMPKGLFLIECKNYSGKIRGSLNYDQKQGEFWTCQTATGEVVQVASSGKNPADQALARFHALHDIAKDAWGEANRPYIYPVLLFPDAADLSGITQMTVYPDRPSSADRVLATTLSKALGYLASADSLVDQAGALKLIDFLGIPRSSLSGTWLVAQPSHVDNGAAKEKQRSDRQQWEQTRQRPNEGGIGAAAHKYGEEIGEGTRPDVRNSSPPRKQQGEVASEYIKGVPPKAPSRQVRWPLVAFSVVVVGLIGLLLTGQFSSKPTIETVSQNPVPSPPTTPQQPTVEPVSPAQPEVSSPPPISKFVTEPPTDPSGKSSTVEPQKPSSDANLKEARLRETPISRRPAEPGNYETIRITNARREPNERADVIDELRRGTKLNVTGSQGDWLVVRSRTRQMTVYVKRDDAMFVSVRSPGGESYQEAEVRWKKVEADITESLAKWGVSGVTASFREDTAYLEGQVKTDYERFRAEMAAKSIPEVQHIINRIRLNP